MDRGIYLAAAGNMSYERVIEITVNNLSNSNVTGFKREFPAFNLDGYYPGSSKNTLDTGSSEAVFDPNRSVYTDFSQGELKKTGNPLDVAISGEGFFVVDSKDGKMYTRKGDFLVDKQGRLTTKSGYAIEGDGGPVTITNGDISIAEDGTISVNGNSVGRLKVVNFEKPYLLEKWGDGLFSPSNAGMKPVPVKDPSIVQGYREMSNVSAVHEMVNMINALRMYESNMKVIKGFDDITESVIRLPG